MDNKKWMGLFLLGLGSRLQLFGTSLCFSELFVYVAAVFVIGREWKYMRRNGVTGFFWLSIFVWIGCVVACLVNHSPFGSALRGLAICTLLPCAIVVVHWMLRRDMNGFKWLILGSVISTILCTFAFQQAVEVRTLAGGENGANATEAIMSGPIYWISRLSGMVMWPASGFYLQCPLAYSALAPLGFALFAMLTSASGRSAALGSIAAAAIVFIGGKTRKQMKIICKNFWFLCIVAIVGLVLLKNLYGLAAETGALGEVAYTKYKVQTRGGDSMLRLLMGGRSEAFTGLLACRDRPIVGYGPWAVDEGQYRQEFMIRFGTEEDFKLLQEEEMRRQKYGGGRSLIPAHSHIVSFWLWYGIFGLIFWLYIIFVLIRFLRQDCYAVPQWFFWLAAGIPGFLWAIFFSPFANRIGSMTFVVACLLARAVRRGRQQLPLEMLKEIAKSERGRAR